MNEVADCIEIPFVMPEPEKFKAKKGKQKRGCNRPGRLPMAAPSHAIVRCTGSQDGQPILEVGDKTRLDNVAGAYYHKSGLLVMVSQVYGMQYVCDVVVPQERKLYYAGFMRPTPERRFLQCGVGRSWSYHREPMTKISMKDLADVFIQHAPFGLPMEVVEYDTTEIPEAAR